MTRNLEENASRDRKKQEAILVGLKTISGRDTPSPLVSVIIPTYNADQFIGQAIQSVLDQTYRSYEIIVVDDGSTDKTKDFLRGFAGQIHCRFQENRGPSAARNTGITIAQGEYICFLDADDLWTPHKLECQLEYMDRHPDIAFVFSDHQDFNARGVLPGSFLENKMIFEDSLIKEGPIQNAFLMLLQENFISTPTVMVKKACFEETGLFDEDLWSVEDRDLWLRMAAKFTLVCLPGILCKRRVHQSNISRQSELTLRSRIKVFEKNKRQFSYLAPAEIWHSALANFYCQIGYVLLENDQRKHAAHAGVKSLKHAFQQMFKRRASSSYPWILGINLIPAALLGRQFSRIIFQPMKRLFGHKGLSDHASSDKKS